MNKKSIKSLSVFFLLISILCSCTFQNEVYESISLGNIPEFSGSPYVVLNNNIPTFKEEDYTLNSYEAYGNLDYLGRCTVAQAAINTDIMPTKERGAIGSVKPTGWRIEKYDFVDGKYLYNRCHLLGYQLTGENANEKNLITGTRYMNTQGMLPFENMVADYVQDTGSPVLMRVTPVFEDKNLVASGVVMEAISLEDEGAGVCFNVYCYNVQPGVTINYLTGESTAEIQQETAQTGEYIINIKSKKIHKPDCSNVPDIKEKNKKIYSGNIDMLLKSGYSSCKSCNP